MEKKLKNGQTKQIRKMKVIEEKSSRAEFISSFKNGIQTSQQHVRRVNIRYSQQRFLKEFKVWSSSYPHGFFRRLQLSFAR